MRPPAFQKEGAVLITNQTPDRVRRILTPHVSVLYDPLPPQWTYSHHASLCIFNGTMHAVWSNSEVDEDERYQRVLHSVSEDRVHWSKPETLFEPTPSGGVWTAAGLYVYGDALNAYAGYYEYKPETAKAGCYTLEHHNTGLFVRTTRNGADWSDLRDLGIPIVPNHGPQRVASGRLIISGNIVFPYTDDPGGQTGWKPVGLPPFPWQNWYDDSEGFWKHYKEINWDQWLCEGSFYQLDNGKLCMLLRSNQKRLFLSESTDSGETWSKPIPTDFTDCGTKFHCGRLPDGRFYVVGNPDPASNRCPLERGDIWLSAYID